MEVFESIFIVTIIVSAIVSLAYIDKRFKLGLNAGFDSEQLLGYQSYSQQSSKQNDDEINALKERIAILEKIVTDPAEQLKREIDNLR